MGRPPPSRFARHLPQMTGGGCGRVGRIRWAHDRARAGCLCWWMDMLVNQLLCLCALIAPFGWSLECFGGAGCGVDGIVLGCFVGSSAAWGSARILRTDAVIEGVFLNPAVLGGSTCGRRVRGGVRQARGIRDPASAARTQGTRRKKPPPSCWRMTPPPLVRGRPRDGAGMW